MKQRFYEVSVTKWVLRSDVNWIKLLVTSLVYSARHWLSVKEEEVEVDGESEQEEEIDVATDGPLVASAIAFIWNNIRNKSQNIKYDKAQRLQNS